MHRHSLAFFFLALLSVTFAENNAPPGLNYSDSADYRSIIDYGGSKYNGSGYNGSNYNGSEYGGFGEGDEILRGKCCSSVLECGTGWLYCIDKICQEKQPGRDCVAEGSFYTGGMSCCPPMVDPRQVNTPCRLLSTTACRSDRDCSIRNGWKSSKCCPSYNEGNGLCIGRTKGIGAYPSSNNVELQSNKLQSKMNFCYRRRRWHKPCAYSD
ncbi:hypothetical protein [Absidia glauca]|uniref:Uncharacterized protein n=1 Tax=Absidia glauca TaxID=4829 RepID=A0A168PQH0_ABSGL|nr:hypothetical protein [Absidia glauca]